MSHDTNAPCLDGKPIKAGWWVILFNGWDPGLRYWTGIEWKHDFGMDAGPVHERHRILAPAKGLPLAWRKKCEARIRSGANNDA